MTARLQTSASHFSPVSFPLQISCYGHVLINQGFDLEARHKCLEMDYPEDKVGDAVEQRLQWGTSGKFDMQQHLTCKTNYLVVSAVQKVKLICRS